MISQIHLFNPGHETAVLLGTENYTPPANVRRMIQELSYLPVWYADSNDYVFTEEIASPRFFSLQPKELRPFATLVSVKELKELAPSLPELAASPWGISPHSLHVFEKLKQELQLNLSVPTWKEEYFRLTGRQTAQNALNESASCYPTFPYRLLRNSAKRSGK
nr:hypothetical protein [Parabacteroides sp. AM58-2XD]